VWKSWPLSFGSRKNYKQECKNTRPIRPTRPEPPFWADDRAAKQKTKSSKNNVITLKAKISFCGRARRAGNFHFPLFFYEWAQSGRISLP